MHTFNFTLLAAVLSYVAVIGAASLGASEAIVRRQLPDCVADPTADACTACVDDPFLVTCLALCDVNSKASFCSTICGDDSDFPFCPSTPSKPSPSK